jgi:hypothetical protein
VVAGAALLAGCAPMSDYIEPEASTSAVTVIDQGNFSGMR